MIADEIDNPIRFPGQFRDRESGLYYNRHRYYDPAIGRYINQDPIGLRGGSNFYAYADGIPTQKIDPSGLGTIAIGAGIGSVVPGPGTLIGAGIGALVMIGAGIWYMTRSTDSTQEKVKEKDDCPNKCNPCKTVSGKIIAVGTFGYRPLDVIPDNEMQHGVYGSHHNIFQANQSPYPKCICFWAKQKYVLKPERLMSSMVPIEPFLNSP